VDQAAAQAYIGAASGDGSDFFHIDASEFIPSTTAGTGIDSTETATNRVNRDGITFDPGSRENATKWFAWPAGWTAAKVTFFWTTTVANNGLDAVLGAEMTTYTDGNSTDLAWGTPQEVADAAVAVNTHRQSPPTAAITPAGTITAGKLTALRIYRNAAAVADNLNVDLLLTGALVEKAS